MYFQEAVSQISHKKINQGIFKNLSKDQGKRPFGFISPIDVYMANGFFSVFFSLFSKITWLIFL
jgi:hypothetical protein